MTSSPRRLTADLSDNEIDLLRERPPAEDEAEQARVQEILEEWDRWSEECADFVDETSLTAALESLDEIVPTQRSVAKRIVDMPATTLAGLQVRALIVAEIFGDQEPDDYINQLMVRAIVRDLVKIAA